MSDLCDASCKFDMHTPFLWILEGKCCEKATLTCKATVHPQPGLYAYCKPECMHASVLRAFKKGAVERSTPHNILGQMHVLLSNRYLGQLDLSTIRCFYI
jgi:hypothetical protein